MRRMNAVARAERTLESGERSLSPLGTRAAQLLLQDADVRATKAIDAVNASPEPRSAIASACRAVGSLFFVGAMSGWHDAEVTSWLRGPYADLAALARRDRALLERDTPRAWSEVDDATLLEASPLEHPMVTRQKVVTLLRELASGHGEPILLSLARGGLLVRRVPFGMSTYWSPSAPVRACVADRVLSLFAVDYLRRPHDYPAPLALCTTCRAPVLDGEHALRCASLVRVTEMPTSGVRESDLDPTA